MKVPFQQYLIKEIKTNGKKVFRLHKIPLCFYDRITKEWDIEDMLNGFYNHIIERVKEKYKEDNIIISKKEARRVLGRYKIPKYFQVRVLIDMQEKGLIKINNRYRVRLL